MNELMITVCNSWFYFKTNKKTAYSALIDFECQLMKAGINFDNMLWDGAELRDSNGDTIEYLEMINGVVIGIKEETK